MQAGNDKSKLVCVFYLDFVTVLIHKISTLPLKTFDTINQKTHVR